LAVPLLAASWALLWTQEAYWNPLLFFGMWLAATMLIYGAAPAGYPGWRRHALLAAVSVPVWWWFELANWRTANWEYITPYDYGVVPYALLASLTFSTVVPALHAACRLTTSAFSALPVPQPNSMSGKAYLAEVGAGTLAVGLTFAFPDLFFPLTWVGPFLLLDGLVGVGGGRSLVTEMLCGEWRLPAAVGLAGLLCGLLWEFWNFWSTPKWVYHVPHLDYLHVFEMPILGYLGYVPFAWSIYQLLQIRPLDRWLDSSRG
jgi:hypothetical protein